ncbi:glycolipid translocation protein [Pneumocystis jirovecii RU7]|uniref:Man(5)GlcNAc(2)-PP-dolichol translocation protein RFT1 n=1 Tax=Pneumocystis jirovecii (strain RU7) TaxID=1408657 RepID=A0A0W4ZK66_PNEJ7|nr:glycolipid translocation protein [Pneumocystis jirovecii RU7]KTW28744.1 hypothetical protein T551_02594 [Pneumocystis jirovecii RU7]
MSKKAFQSTTRGFLATSIANVSYLITLQFFSRLITFILNQMILRFTIPEIFGFAMVQVELLISIILFLSREGFRVALQRHDIFKETKQEKNTSSKETLVYDKPEDEVIQRLVNLAYVPIPISIVLSILVFFFYILIASNSTKKQPVFKETIILYVFSTVIEIFTEPLFILTQQYFLYKIRAISEASAIFLKCCITFLLTYWFNLNGNIRKYGALPFAFGQLGYSDKLCFFPRKIYSSSNKSLYLFHQPTLMLAITITSQSLFKYILTEGDRFLITWFMTDFEQGIYALVVNYGSLIARLIFNPIEELSRNVFSKLCLKRNNDKCLLARNILLVIIKLYIIFGIFVITFGPLYCSVFIKIVAGSKWSKTYAPSVLKLYLFYIPIMAINGITEAFVQAVATPNDIKKQSCWMFFFSGLFMFMGFIFLNYFKLGINGIVFINMINLSARAIWSLVYIRNYFGNLVIELFFPSKMFSFLVILIGYLMQLKMQSIATISDILTGIMIAGFLFCICIFKERNMLKMLYIEILSLKA